MDDRDAAPEKTIKSPLFKPGILSKIANETLAALKDAEGHSFPCSVFPIAKDAALNFVVVPSDGTLFRYFFLSDIHGDADLFRKALDRADESSRAAGKQPVVVILGDLIDRGPDSADCIAMLLRLCLGLDRRHRAMKVLFVRGDHDEALVSFGSRVRPSEFAEELQFLIRKGARRETALLCLAEAFSAFVRSCPAAVLFSSGVLCSHGGVPHTDVQAGVHSANDLHTPAAAQDFVWCRFTERAPKKFPNRRDLTCQIGFRDVDAYLSLLDDLHVVAAPVSIWIHGHEHPKDGSRVFLIPDSNRRVITFASCHLDANDENGGATMLEWDGMPEGPFEAVRLV